MDMAKMWDLIFSFLSKKIYLIYQKDTLIPWRKTLKIFKSILYIDAEICILHECIEGEGYLKLSLEVGKLEINHLLEINNYPKA